MNPPRGAAPQSAQQFPRDDRAAAAKDGHRPRPPHQSVDDLVQLRIRHAAESSIPRSPKPAGGDGLNFGTEPFRPPATHWWSLP